MKDFEYHVPTKVVFGRGGENQVGRLCKEDGATKVLVHFGGNSAKKSGLLDRVYASLEEAGIPYVTLGGVSPNPLLSLIREGIELCKKEGVDYLLPVGGGSVIDSAKAIGCGVAGEGDIWEYYQALRVPEKCLPIGCVLTIAAAGSEMSNSSVVTNDETREKRAIGSNVIIPRFSVMNPELTMTLPAYHTAAGVADTIMHTLERYFVAENPTMTITDTIAEGLLRDVMENGKILCRNPKDYNARANIMWASSLSHNGLTGLGGPRGDWATHQFGHELSGKYDMTHGASLTSVWGSWARYVCKDNPERFAQFAVNVMEVPDDGNLSVEELALAGIEEMEEFFWAIEMPTKISEADIHPTEEDIVAMAQGVSRGETRLVGDIKKLNTEDAINIFKMAL